jgi:hypothetical protein
MARLRFYYGKRLRPGIRQRFLNTKPPQLRTVLSHFGITVRVAFGGMVPMLQKLPEKKTGTSWTPQEVEELRSSLRTSSIADVDTEMFAKRFSEIVGRAQSQKKHSRVQRTQLPEQRKVNGLLRRDDSGEACAVDRPAIS